MAISRRQFLTSAALAGSAGVVAGSTGLGGASRPAAAATPLPSPATSSIDHIVVVMMENRSFDHFLGWLPAVVPGADGKQAGLSYTDRYGQSHRSYRQTAYASCGFADPDHSWEGGRQQLNGGKCDGWLKTLDSGGTDTLPISYFTKSQLPFIGEAAAQWTTCDRYFSAIMAETYPNRFYQHAAATDRLHNSTAISTLPTIWDRLKAKGVSGTYYFNDIPFLALWGQKYIDISKPYDQFKADAAAGTLPSVSYIDPRFNDEASGTSGDDHPHADIRAGEAFLSDVYNTVTSSPNWANTLLVINFDEWGGFFDHVAPSRAPDRSNATSLRGFRVPALIISPRARRKHIEHTVFDHTSVLRAIEWRFGLQGLSPRDLTAANLMTALDFSTPADLTVPAIAVPPPPLPVPCVPSAPVPSVAGSEDGEWTAVKKLALDHGWTLPS